MGGREITADEAKPYISYVLDTALSSDRKAEAMHPGARLVGWQCGFEPMFVLVVDAYDWSTPEGWDKDYPGIDEDEAAEIATDYLDEIGWFGEGRNPTEPDYNIAVR